MVCPASATAFSVQDSADCPCPILRVASHCLARQPVHLHISVHLLARTAPQIDAAVPGMAVDLFQFRLVELQVFQSIQ